MDVPVQEIVIPIISILRICPTCSRLQKEERKATLLEDMKKEQEYYEKKQVWQSLG